MASSNQPDLGSLTASPEDTVIITISSTPSVNRSIHSTQLFYNDDAHHFPDSYTLTEQIVCFGDSGPLVQLCKRYDSDRSFDTNVERSFITTETVLTLDPVFKGVKPVEVGKDTYMFTSPDGLQWLIVGTGNRCEVSTVVKL